MVGSTFDVRLEGDSQTVAGPLALSTYFPLHFSRLSSPLEFFLSCELQPYSSLDLSFSSCPPNQNTWVPLHSVSG